MQPQDAAALRHKGSPGQLQDVTMLLKRPSETDREARGFGGGAPLAAFWSGKQNAPPVGALEAHGTVTLALGIRDAHRGNSMTPAESRHFFGGTLHDAAELNAALVESRERLAQLRECFRVERSAKMSQPEDERWPAGPEVRE